MVVDAGSVAVILTPVESTVQVTELGPILMFIRVKAVAGATLIGIEVVSFPLPVTHW